MRKSNNQTVAEPGVVVKRVVSLRMWKIQEAAAKAGYDAGKNGPNQINCDFRHFCTPESTKRWEEGKAKAESEKQANAPGEPRRERKQ